MQDLSIWAQFSIVAAAAVLGPAASLLLALVVAMLARWAGPANAPPPLVIVGIDLAGKLLRRRFGRGGAAALSASQKLRSESAHSASVSPTPAASST